MVANRQQAAGRRGEGADPPDPLPPRHPRPGHLSALRGRVIEGTQRHGKFLDLTAVPAAVSSAAVSSTAAAAEGPAPSAAAPAGPDGALHLITHLARGGWLQWREKLSPAPPRPGGRVRSPSGCTWRPIRRRPGPGFDLTEAGTQKRLAVYLVRDPLEVPGIARLGPDALRVTPATTSPSLLRGQRGQIKGVLDRPGGLAGIGNAYSDEILHAARLSPFAIAAEAHRGRGERGCTTAIAGALTDAVAPLGRAEGRHASRGRSAAGCASTPGPGCRARCAATRYARCRSPTSRSSTARPARPAASHSPTGDCPG